MDIYIRVDTRDTWRLNPMIRGKTKKQLTP